MFSKINPPYDYAKATGMTNDEISKALQSALNAPSSAGQLMSKMVNNTSDASVFVCSDSTGNEATEWVYLYSEWLASSFPEFTVNYYLWDTVGYASAVAIQTGTGSNTLSIYNGAISGTKISYLTGDKFNAAVRDIPDCDLIIINHGHNMINSYSQNTLNTNKGSVPQFIESIDKMLNRHYGAGVLMLTQNPRRDDDQCTYIFEAIVKVAALINADIADSHSLFIAAGKDSSLYKDNIHPSATGTQLYLSTVKHRHASLACKSASTLGSGINLLDNGGFDSLDGSNIPNGFTLSSQASSAIDNTNYDSAKGYSLAITMDTSSISAKLYASLSSAARATLAGGWVTLAVRVRIPAGSPSTVARPSIDTNLSTIDINYTLSDDTQDEFVWRCVSAYIEQGVSFMTVGVFVDTGGNIGSVLNVDRMILSKGKLIGPIV